MQLNKLLVPAVATALLLPSAVAHADFGSRGVFVLEGDIDLDAARVSEEGRSSATKGVDLGVNVKYFVADHIAVGGGLDFVHTWYDDDGGPTLVAGRLTAAYQARSSARVSVLPQLIVGYGRKSDNVLGDDVVLTSIGVSAFVPFVFEPADHFIIGWGPEVATELYVSFDRNGMSSDSSKSTLFGTHAFVAGWF
jgi:hypothetical protein